MLDSFNVTQKSAFLYCPASVTKLNKTLFGSISFIGASWILGGKSEDKKLAVFYIVVARKCLFKVLVKTLLLQSQCFCPLATGEWSQNFRWISWVLLSSFIWWPLKVLEYECLALAFKALWTPFSNKQKNSKSSRARSWNVKSRKISHLHVPFTTPCKGWLTKTPGVIWQWTFSRVVP